MGRNVEIKAMARDATRQREIALRLCDDGPTTLIQTDTFFHVASGRLKLRAFASGGGELIQYHRPDRTAPTTSDYTIVPTEDPSLLKDALSSALGVLGVVRKVRTLFVIGQTRVHFDDVESLGAFIELEVVLRPPEAEADGMRIAEALMHDLGIAEDDLIDRAYIDLLCADGSATKIP